MKIAIVIPARYHSSRLEGKLMLPIDGKAVLRHVYDNLKDLYGVDGVFVATDSELIKSWGQKRNIPILMTSDQHISGTDRIAEACANIDCDYIINVQGDEPLISKDHIKPLIDAFSKHSDAGIFTLFELGTDQEVYSNPNDVKLVCDENDNAFYFSRAPIPYHREAAAGITYKKHIGVYAFKKEVLLEISKLSHGKLETTEKLEQLRWLENGYAIKAIEVPGGLMSVDTQEDYDRVKAKMEGT